MILREKQIKEFQTYIFSWWKTNSRDLPWRHTHDPYKILVSEVMLQQTQVQRVIPKYLEFIKRFPTVSNLAKASSGDVLRMWKALGYNRRALYLKRSAEQIVKDYKGIFPITDKELTQLPGLGIYTARAICIFAYEQDVAAVDVNIKRIITHFFFNDVPQKQKTIDEIALQLVPKGKSWEWHQALMDYGALELQKISSEVGKVKRKAVPFKKTDRFVRGKIIDKLRETAVDKNIFLQEISYECNRSMEIVSKIITGLKKDGLLKENRKTYSLPN